MISGRNQIAILPKKMDINSVKIKPIRTLIDKYFSLQWCRDNMVVPVAIEPSLPPAESLVTIAVANIIFLGTIGQVIKERLKNSGYRCKYIELSSEEIQEVLDLAVEERFEIGEQIDLEEFTEDAVLAALQDSSELNNNDEFLLEFEDFAEEMPTEEAIELSDEMLNSKTQKAVGLILINACRSGVSDIHIEPNESNYKIRVRKDGVLQKFLSVPNLAGRQVLACLKNMAEMDIAERRASQDGKILRKFEGKKMEFRCSTAPAKYGEGMVLRILNSDSSILNLDTLVHLESVRKEFRNAISSPNGIVIVSGPTGSGKSTTLASALKEIDNGELKIVTAEDPIEYDLGGDIVQHQINRAKKQTFSNFLRTFLRQDPDVILIGETRDPETAESSMDAAETGHLVFTTLHANTAASSLVRLLDMGVPPYKINSSIRAILAQRLIRKVCPHCSIKRPIEDSEADLLKIRRNTPIRFATVLNVEEKEKRRKEKTLCLSCNGSGYNGRIGTYEFLPISREIQIALKEKKSDLEIQNIAEENGMLTLMNYGKELILKELSTVSELLRACRI